MLVHQIEVVIAAFLIGLQDLLVPPILLLLQHSLELFVPLVLALIPVFLEQFVNVREGAHADVDEEVVHEIGVVSLE